jgi:hypothetical protein
MRSNPLRSPPPPFQSILWWQHCTDLRAEQRRTRGLTLSQGRAIAQAVSRWLPTAAARVRARVWSCRICGGQSGAEAGFLRVLRFPLPIFIPPIAPQSPSSIIWGLYNRPEVAALPRDLVPPHKKNTVAKTHTLTWLNWTSADGGQDDRVVFIAVRTLYLGGSWVQVNTSFVSYWHVATQWHTAPTLVARQRHRQLVTQSVTLP